MAWPVQSKVSILIKTNWIFQRISKSFRYLVYISHLHSFSLGYEKILISNKLSFNLIWQLVVDSAVLCLVFVVWRHPVSEYSDKSASCKNTKACFHKILSRQLLEWSTNKSHSCLNNGWSSQVNLNSTNKQGCSQTEQSKHKVSKPSIQFTFSQWMLPQTHQFFQKFSLQQVSILS